MNITISLKNQNLINKVNKNSNCNTLENLPKIDNFNDTEQQKNSTIILKTFPNPTHLYIRYWYGHMKEAYNYHYNNGGYKKIDYKGSVKLQLDLLSTNKEENFLYYFLVKGNNITPIQKVLLNINFKKNTSNFLVYQNKNNNELLGISNRLYTRESILGLNSDNCKVLYPTPFGYKYLTIGHNCA